MSLDDVVEARIHPAIGIARVGNSPEGRFFGPETLTHIPEPDGYKDGEGRLKRQAARFRVYGYDAKGRCVQEITAAEADITWTVEVANKKAAWYNFDIALDIPEAANVSSARRNVSIAGADRKKLEIKPRPCTVVGAGAAPAKFEGQFWDQKVYLGEIYTDEYGRLVFLGGHGVSGTPFSNNPVTTFANNLGWYDDTSDGPVRATVRIKGRTGAIEADPAWVVAAPPDYAPGIVVAQTLYDVINDRLSGFMTPSVSKPSFTRHILPILQELSLGQWVNAGMHAQFGYAAPYDFFNPDLIAKLADPGDHPRLKVLRQQIFHCFRNADYSLSQPHRWPPLYGDAYGDSDTEPLPRAGLAITPVRYKFLKQWADGNFHSDYPAGAPQTLENIAPQEQPAMLDQAALHFCTGGPFHPGCELTWPMRSPSLYRAAFRVRHRPADVPEPDWGDTITRDLVRRDDGPLGFTGPGDLTRWMAVPWQSDAASCRSGYETDYYPDLSLPSFWPARVPNDVLTEEHYRRVMDLNLSHQERVDAFNTA